MTQGSNGSRGQPLGALVAVASIALCAVPVWSCLKREKASAPSPISASGGVVEVAFYTSNAKKTWIDGIVKSFNASGATASGKQIRVKAVHVNSGDSLEQIKGGKIRPDVWSPGDDSW